MKISALLFPLLCQFAFSVKHSLKYFYIASSGVDNLPEFMAVTMVDETVVAYCGTKIDIKQDWLKKIFEKEPQHLERYTKECLETQPNYFRATIHNLKQRFNQSGGVHILQRVSGCELDDETQELNGFNQYGYNGEDFISFDLKTLTWIAPGPQAFTTKLKWDAEKDRGNYNKNHLTKAFPKWLEMYLYHGRGTLMRTELPSVSLLQKSPSSPVTCHATGFYPDRALMFWRKDGEKLHEDVNVEILPNHDGSFQMSVDLLNLPSEDWGRYECVFQLTGVKEDIITKLNKDVIRSNHDVVWKNTAWVPFPVAGVVLVICVVVFMFRQRKKW